MEEVNELLRKTIENMVDYPDEVCVHIKAGERRVILDIFVADEDVGKVLGRGGSYAESLRTLFGAMYGRLGKRITLDVIAPPRRHR